MVFFIATRWEREGGGGGRGREEGVREGEREFINSEVLIIYFLSIWFRSL
jgi:hypothetical protein